ncbi:MAG: HD domain-containing protein [Bacteroidetes bacterium]|nr:HD domain-containing protein [Bacteroidota bacterium]
MTADERIPHIEDFVRQFFAHDSSGHDSWHCFRVRDLAVKIAAQYSVNKEIVEISALLHDVTDWKMTADKETAVSKVVELLSTCGFDKSEVAEIISIIDNVSFQGAGTLDGDLSIEGQIVRDADRLDAIGAIGIARTFAYGGSKKRQIFDPVQRPVIHASFEEYKKSDGPTINHFYEKLLLLKDRMHTEVARSMAEERHSFMEKFLEHFFGEWNISK